MILTEGVQVLDVSFKNRQMLKQHSLRESRHGGLVVSSDRPIKPDDRVALRIWLRREDLSELIQGCVLWCRPETQATRLAGICFLEREAEKYQRLMRGLPPEPDYPADRKESRINLSIKVRYRHDDTLVVANTANLSPGGMFLQTPSIPPLGEVILFTLYPPYTSNAIQLTGRVAWQDFRAGVGVEFSQPIPDGP